ncbi:hypothetical protein [Candidatus Darwinibacter acetoxidans]
MKRTIGIAIVLLIGATLTGCIGVKRPDIAVSGFVLDSDTGAGVGGVEVVVGSLGRTVTSENGSWSFSKAKKGAEVSVSNVPARVAAGQGRRRCADFLRDPDSLQRQRCCL